MRDAFEAVVREAGKLALEATLVGEIHTKGRSDFVTGADLAVSSFLSQELMALVPGSRVMSEEGDTEAGLEGKLFIIDPIDGTTNLMYGLGLSALSVAYAKDGQIQLAAILNPFTNELFLAEKGMGATRNGVPIHVNQDKELSEALIGVEAGPATVSRQESFFQKLYSLNATSRGIRLTGSAAIDLAYVACGRLSACVFPYLYPWDYAAGWLILAEAGGMLTDMRGENLPLQGRSEFILASNSQLHAAFLEAFA